MLFHTKGQVHSQRAWMEHNAALLCLHSDESEKTGVLVLSHGRSVLPQEGIWRKLPKVKTLQSEAPMVKEHVPSGKCVFSFL